MARKNKINWSLYDHLLGTDTDEKIAVIVGCTDCNIRFRRKKLGVPPAKYPTWSLEDESLLNSGLARCTECGEIKSLSDYYREKDQRRRTGTRRTCKRCDRQRARKQWEDTKRAYIDSLGGKCQYCGYDKCLSPMQFHHVEDDKEFMISRKRSLRNKTIIMAELNKCCLLCSNCHDSFHGGELDITFKKLPFGWTVDSSEVPTSPPNICLTEDRVNHF